MRFEYHDPALGGRLLMAIEEPDLARNFFKELGNPLNSIIWNRGKAQHITVDEMRFEMPENSFFTLNVSHTFRLDRSQDAVFWQFNRDFYCIVMHDAEVSCNGLLFYGWREAEPIFLDDREARSIGLLAEVFQEEFENRDNIQGEMLRMLLKRLIIKLTRLIKSQSTAGQLTVSELDTIRQFNFLVETHFKKLHQVQDYASLMSKSPKTLSNLFAKYSEKSPLQIILERIFLESKRLMIYTDMYTGQIGFELGFEEPAHFSRFFKKMAGISPSEFRISLKQGQTSS